MQKRAEAEALAASEWRTTAATAADPLDQIPSGLDLNGGFHPVAPMRAPSKLLSMPLDTSLPGSGCWLGMGGGPMGPFLSRCPSLFQESPCLSLNAAAMEQLLQEVALLTRVGDMATEAEHASPQGRSVTTFQGRLSNPGSSISTAAPRCSPCPSRQALAAAGEAGAFTSCLQPPASPHAPAAAAAAAAGVTRPSTTPVPWGAHAVYPMSASRQGGGPDGGSAQGWRSSRATAAQMVVRHVGRAGGVQCSLSPAAGQQQQQEQPGLGAETGCLLACPWRFHPSAPGPPDPLTPGGPAGLAASLTAVGQPGEGLLPPGLSVPHDELSNASEAQQLEASNAVLQQQLDALLLAMRTMHQDNEAMKQQLLVSCRRCEIPAQLEQLNARIAQHQPPSQPSDAATHLAASVLEQCGQPDAAAVWVGPGAAWVATNTALVKPEPGTGLHHTGPALGACPRCFA
ncbi:hypothetical protein V8C86DRAFT_3025941 [Haematococcus lacustris]